MARFSTKLNLFTKLCTRKQYSSPSRKNTTKVWCLRYVENLKIIINFNDLKWTNNVYMFQVYDAASKQIIKSEFQNLDLKFHRKKINKVKFYLFYLFLFLYICYSWIYFEVRWNFVKLFWVYVSNFVGVGFCISICSNIYSNIWFFNLNEMCCNAI